MIALSLILMAPAQVAAAVPANEDIVVIARRLSNIQVSYGFRRNRLQSCSIVRTSGDPMIDRVVCETARECAAGKKASTESIQACMGTHRDHILETVAAQKAVAQAGRSNASN